MAKGKLTPESKAEFAKKLAASKASNAKAKAKTAGVDPEIKAKGVRTADQIMKDIEKVKASPAFKKKEAAIAKAMATKNKTVSASDLKKLVKEAHKLDPMKPIPASTQKKMDATIANLAKMARGGGMGGAFSPKNK